ncbi:DUF1700 domain-containing protein [Bacillus sp. JCM 19041]|uniref:HAAS signaling domain-containing protein n=1 Tax=Bacillus sp. JCM 19041 TaxID=1460637 RepID=UPI0006CF8CA0
MDRKKDFLKALDKHLSALPSEEKHEVMNDHREYFREGLDQQKNEQELINGLGSPKKLAKEIIAASSVDQASNNKTVGSLMKAVMTVSGLSLFNFLFVLTPFIAIAALVLSLWFVILVGLASPFIAFGAWIYANETINWLDWTAAFGMCILALLLIRIMKRTTKWLATQLLRYLKMNGSIVRNGISG